MLPSPFAPAISDRFGLTNVFSVGALGMALSLVWLGLVGDTYLSVLAPLVFFGLSMGLSMSPATKAITDTLPAEKQGTASALNDTVREAGSALGIALLGSILTSGYASNISGTVDTLPPELGEPVGEGIGQAMFVASQLGPEGAQIASAANDAFMDGWTTTMLVAAAVAALAAVAFRKIGPGRSAIVVDLNEESVAAPSDGRVSARSPHRAPLR